MEHGLDELLVRQDILGCDGKISHRLVVEVDGSVRVSDAHGHVVRVDARARTQFPPSPRLSRGLIDSACALAAGAC